jgi:hypothetical protein
MFQPVACIWKLMYLPQTLADAQEGEQEISKEDRIGDSEDDNDARSKIT